MNVVMVDSRKKVEVPDSYGMRLIEQGRAIIAPSASKNDDEQAEQPKKKRKGDA